eukprot:314400_1
MTLQIYEYLLYIFSTLIYAMTAFFSASLSPIADVLQSNLDITSSSIGLLSSVYFITYLLFQIPFGILLQNYSHHMLLLIVSIGIIICTCLFGFIESLTFAIIVRTLTGIFASPIWIIMIHIVGDYFGNNKVSFFVGISGLVVCAIMFIGVFLQGYIYDKYKIWRITYYIISGIGFFIVSGIVVIMNLQHKYIQKQSRSKLNNSNISWANLFLENSNSNLLSAANISRTDLFSDDKIIMCATGSSPKQIDTPKSNKFVLTITNPLNWYLGIYGFTLMSLYFAVFGLFLIPYLMLKFDYSRSLASFLSGIGIGTTGIGSVTFGYFSTRFQNRKIYFIISDLLVSCMLYIVFVDAELMNVYVVFVIMVFVGFGAGNNTIMFTLCREYNSRYGCEEIAAGFVNMIMCSGGFIAPYITGYLIDYHWELHNVDDGSVRQYNEDDYSWAFACIIPTCLIFAIVTSILLKETNGQNF